MVSRHAALVLALVAGTASAAPKAKAKLSPAQEAEVKQHVDAATAAHAAGKLDVALTELRAAYAIDPQPDLLFATGQVQAELGQCDDARTSFEQYRTAMKDEAGIGSAIDAAIAACAAPAPAAAVPPPAPPPPPTRAPWYTDAVGDALVGGGVVALVASGLEYRAARSKLDDAEHAANLADYSKSVDSAHSDRTISVVLGVAGVALVAGGVVRYVMHGKTSAEHVAIVPMAGGGMISISGGL